ncbi:nucleolar DEAD-box protein required for synthesis of 60S ribosomal subunit [Coemansia sp. RSA 1285]|nr:nucleolar DEAD-box protein required for synthesis of 60S ribosomal subunit [Coemansia sp. RSA 1285]
MKRGIAARVPPPAADADGFIMTISDNDEVPDLEEETGGGAGGDATEQSAAGRKRRARKKGSSSKRSKKEAEGEEEEEEGMAKGFMIDLEADGFDAAAQTLDFTLARAALKTRGAGAAGMFSSLDERIAAVRRAARAARAGGEEDKEAGGGSASEAEESAAEASSSRSGSSYDDDDDGGGDGGGGSASDSDAVDEQEQARRRAFFAAPDADAAAAALPDSFAAMNLSRPIMRGLTKLGFVQPTAIQARTIPVALLGKDVCGGAQTGSGKTAAFLVPILERLQHRPRAPAATRVVVLCPTRELAIQCHSVGTRLAAFTDITQCLCIGGLSLKAQEAELRTSPDVVVATPGRLIDHLRNSRAFAIDAVEILLIRVSLNKPVRVQVDPPRAAARGLAQEFVRVRSSSDADRTALLVALCKRSVRGRCIVFFRSKMAAHHMKIVFGLLGLRAAELHGNLSQEARLLALELFRDAHVDYLLATDLAARGLDVAGVDTVINYSMPAHLAQYLHRVGRTARAGRTGRAITLVAEPDRRMLKAAVKHSPPGAVSQRVVPAPALAKYRARVDALADQVRTVVDQIRHDRAIRDAEIHAAKAANLLCHSDEIAARPRRTWFQTSAARRRAKDAGGKEYARAQPL